MQRMKDESWTGNGTVLRYRVIQSPGVLCAARAGRQLSMSTFARFAAAPQLRLESQLVRRAYWLRMELPRLSRRGRVKARVTLPENLNSYGNGSA